MKKLTLLITLLSILTLTGCTANKSSDLSSKSTDIKTSDNNSESDSDSEVTKDPASSEATPILEKISAEKAKEMMDASSDLIILDVRTEEEYKSGFIEGALLLPDYEVESKVEEMLKDKSVTILVYCRSGRRSALVAQTLSDLGYTVIYDFGGITDWPYDVVTE